MTTLNLIAVSAGLSQPSSTRLLAERLLDATATTLREGGATVSTEIIDLRSIAHDIVDTMLTGFAPERMEATIETVTGADGLILVTPLFTTTYSGLFKSFLDILDKESLTGMPVLLGATGGTPRHSLALDYSMRPLLTYLRAQVATTSVFAATDDWAGSGDGVSPLPARITRAGRELAQLVESRGGHRATSVFDSPPSFDELMGGI